MHGIFIVFVLKIKKLKIPCIKNEDTSKNEEMQNQDIEK